MSKTARKTIDDLIKNIDKINDEEFNRCWNTAQEKAKKYEEDLMKLNQPKISNKQQLTEDKNHEKTK
jgi:hypothetical protein